MAATYERLPDGGYVLRHDNGLVEYFDANGQPIGTEYAGAQPVTDTATLPTGTALVVDANGTPVKDRSGKNLAAPVPEGVDPTYYEMPGHPGYDGGLIPSYFPTASTPAPASSGSGQYTADSYDYGSGGYNRGYSRSYGGYSGGGGYSSGGGYNPYTSSSSQSGGYGFGSMPSYANGQMHPAFGGQPLTPGGYYRGPQGGTGYDNRQQVRVPGGATAGPFEVASAPTPTGYGNNGAYGGGRSWNDQGRQGGGGGSNMGANSAIGQKLAGKVRGMAAKIQGGGSSSSYGGDTASYKRQQRQYKQQQRAYEDGSYIYDQYKMRGFSKKMDPQQAEGFYYRPQMMIPKVAPGLSKTSPRYDFLETLPANQLSTMAFGSRGKAKAGPSQYVNNLARFYRDVANRNDLPEYDKLVSNLQHARGKSMLGQQFKQPLGFAADAYQSMVDAAMSVYEGSNDAAAARSKLASRYINDYGAKFAKQKAGKGKSINKYVGRRMTGEW